MDILHARFYSLSHTWSFLNVKREIKISKLMHFIKYLHFSYCLFFLQASERMTEVKKEA